MPKNDYFSGVNSVCWNWLCIPQEARPGSTMCCRWYGKKKCGRPSFPVHESQISTPVCIRTPPKLQNGRCCNDCVASHTDYGWCKLRAMVTKENDMRFASQYLEKKMKNAEDYLDKIVFSNKATFHLSGKINPLNPELNPICYLLALLGAHHFLHVSRIRVKLLTFRLLVSYLYGAPILDVSRSHTTTQHSR